MKCDGGICWDDGRGISPIYEPYTCLCPNWRLLATQTASHELERGFELMVINFRARINRIASGISFTYQPS